MNRNRIAIIAAFVFVAAFVAAVALHWITFGVEVTPVATVNIS